MRPVMVVDRVAPDDSGAGDSPTAPETALWAAAAPYVPSVLLDAFRQDPDRPAISIDAVEGTLVFADISGFTALSERLAGLGREGPERLTEIINGNFQLLLDIARQRGGGNLKFGGDALALLFEGPGHAHRAVTAGLAMQRAIRGYGLIRAVRPPVRLRMSVGIHSGQVWSATAGDPDLRMQHFILGRESARLAETEAAASPGEVLLTEETRRLVAGLVAVEAHEGFFRAQRLIRQPAALGGAAAAPPPPASHASLLAFLPPPVAAVLRGGVGRASIEGEHRKVSIAFISVRGGNELLDTAGPEALLAELQAYLSAVVRLVDQHGGFLVSNDIDNHGLKLILVFGAPVAHEEDAANALRLALALQQELRALDLRLSHRIGVNSGSVFVGDVGSDHRRDYTVMGDAVNLAARLMSAAESGQVLISDQLAQEAGAGFLAPELAPIRVKGKAQPIAIRELAGEEAVQPGGTGREAALVGRAAEIEILQRLCREAEVDGSRAVVLVGDAGAGKTRLLQELEHYQRERGWRTLRGHCYAHTAATPFYPWTQILEALFAIGDRSQSRTARGGRVAALVQRVRPDLRELASLLNTLLSLEIPESDLVRSLDDESRRQRLFELIAALLGASADTTPLGLLIEDLHFADQSSLRLLEHVATTAGAGVLLGLTQRPSDTVRLDFPQADTTRLELPELTEDASRDLICAILNRPDLPAPVAAAISAKCRGNPLFLEEVARSLRDSPALEALLSASGVALDAAMQLEIPDRVQALIMSRIDALPPDTKRVLRFASVLGASFAVSTLQSLARADVDADAAALQLPPLLRALEEAELVVAEPGDAEPSAPGCARAAPRARGAARRAARRSPGDVPRPG